MDLRVSWIIKHPMALNNTNKIAVKICYDLFCIQESFWFILSTYDFASNCMLFASCNCFLPTTLKYFIIYFCHSTVPVLSIYLQVEILATTGMCKTTCAQVNKILWTDWGLKNTIFCILTHFFTNITRKILLFKNMSKF